MSAGDDSTRGANGSNAARPIDLVLGQGSASELATLRAQLARDPLLALEVAETRQLIETLRDVRVEPSQHHLRVLDSLARRAGERQARRHEPVAWTRRWGTRLLQFAAAAAIVFGALAVLDPLRLRSHARAANADMPRVAETAPAPQIQLPPASSRLRQPEALAAIRAAAERLASGPRLPAAVQRFQNLGQQERLRCWLQADNLVAAARESFESRATAEVRCRLLDSRNAAAIDERVQALAIDLHAELREPTSLPWQDVAVGLRALLASGRVRADDPVLHAGAERIAAALPMFHDGELATALATLAEVAAASGRYVDELQEHGERLVRSLLESDVDRWTRRLPQLLAAGTPAAQVADAGRFLALAPAFGVDAEAALLSRLLLAAQLQERRDLRAETPELLAALVYGFGDVLLPSERREVEERLVGSWRPAKLVPDYIALQQWAWSMSPASSGYAEFRREAEQIATLATPTAVRERAAFCLCLATPFAVLPRTSGGRLGD